MRFIDLMTEEKNNKNNPTILNIFDFDGTLMDSPGPEIGKQKYKEITGKDWPHKGWWGQIDSLEPFDVKPIKLMQIIYDEYSSLPNSLNVLMTNRMSKFEPIVKDKLKDYYTFDQYNFKSGGKEKPDRIKEILLNNPSIKTINIFDDMDEQILRFNKFKKEHPELKVNILQIK